MVECLSKDKQNVNYYHKKVDNKRSFRYSFCRQALIFVDEEQEGRN